MNLNTKHLKAILDIPHLKEILIDGEITEKDCLNFEFLDDEKKKLIFNEVIDIMSNGSVECICIYSNPDSEYIDPFAIYGENGFYMVAEVDWGSFTFFTNKKDAIEYTNNAFDEWVNFD